MIRVLTLEGIACCRKSSLSGLPLIILLFPRMHQSSCQKCINIVKSNLCFTASSSLSIVVIYRGFGLPPCDPDKIFMPGWLFSTFFIKALAVDARLLRDSHLDLKIETLKENSRLILDLDSQFFSENSHSHSQLSKIF